MLAAVSWCLESCLPPPPPCTDWHRDHDDVVWKRPMEVNLKDCQSLSFFFKLDLCLLNHSSRNFFNFFLLLSFFSILNFFCFDTFPSVLPFNPPSPFLPAYKLPHFRRGRQLEGIVQYVVCRSTQAREPLFILFLGLFSQHCCPWKLVYFFRESQYYVTTRSLFSLSLILSTRV